MPKTYVVNHTLLGTGQSAGQAFTPEEDGASVKNLNTGTIDPVDVSRLLSLGAIREATPQEQSDFEQFGTLDTLGIVQGDAPAGQTRVSSDTFAPVPPADVAYAGGKQSAKSSKQSQ